MMVMSAGIGTDLGIEMRASMDEQHVHAARTKLTSVALIATLRLATLTAIVGGAGHADLHDAYR